MGRSTLAPKDNAAKEKLAMPLGIDKKAVVGTLALAGVLKIGLSMSSVSEIDKARRGNSHFPKPFVQEAKSDEEIAENFVEPAVLPVEILEKDFEIATNLKKPAKKFKKHQKRKIETPKTYLVLPRS